MLPSQKRFHKQAIADAVAKHASALKVAAPDESAVPVIPGKPMVDGLNEALEGEFEAEHQYTAHYAIALNSGYTKLAASLKERRDDERKHIDLVTYRIVFLGGTPVVGVAVKAGAGKTVPVLLGLDKAKEETAIALYDKLIAQAVELKDNATRAMLESILKDEDEHIDEITTDLSQIEQMGIGPYLVTQVD